MADIQAQIDTSIKDKNTLEKETKEFKEKLIHIKQEIVKVTEENKQELLNGT